jgi:hypothetical protein
VLHIHTVLDYPGFLPLPVFHHDTPEYDICKEYYSGIGILFSRSVLTSNKPHWVSGCQALDDAACRIDQTIS